MQDITHALSLKCRHGGHCPRFYSIAQHSVLVSNWLIGEPLITQLAGLLHDAAEAYTPDLPGPVKRHPTFGAVRELEDSIDSLIVEKFLIPQTEHGHLSLDWQKVKEADKDLLSIECVSLWGCQPIEWGLANPIKYEPINPWRPSDARLMFEDRYSFLMQGLAAERESRKP